MGDPRYEHMRTLDDVPPHFIRELENFFSTYKEMQHKKTEVRGFFGEEEAVKQLEKAYARYRERYL